ncbi:hypothetical protein UVI_02026400 [Ustilaginoidea virens]|uniref:C2H2-type domain-containing protein n=1 Tax=Ustilaginoidea virens TaxID=1159556 RepID=A0A1B5L123_USTVR|nr:hypothetical protein UVI_02026400 [Ustilaginoidea virens]
MEKPSRDGPRLGPDDWPSYSYPHSSQGYNIVTGPYAIQKFSVVQSDDPFVPAGTVPTHHPLSDGQQAQYAQDAQHLRDGSDCQNPLGQSADGFTNHGDSGYGGSHPSGSVASPSVKVGPKCKQCQYIVRDQPESTENSDVSVHVREEARENDLQGVGSLPGFASPFANMTVYANEIANLPGDQTSNLTQQRFNMVFRRNFHVLTSTNILEHQADQELGFINPHVLRQETGHGMRDPLQHAASTATALDSSADHLSVISSEFHNPSSGDDANDTHFPRRQAYEVTALGHQPTCMPSTAYLNMEQVAAPQMSPMTHPLAQTNQPGDVMALLEQPPPEISKTAANEVVVLDSAGAAITRSTSQPPVPSCANCGKTFKRSCELTKHKKRHSKPYGCTWLDCAKTFGSKNDWKRHESKQHFKLQTWNRDMGECEETLDRRDALKVQMRRGQGSTGTGDGQCRRGSPIIASFWCGFCVGHVDVDHDKGSDNALTQRFDHIDDHFCGRDGFTKRSIEDWKHEPRPGPTLEARDDGRVQTADGVPMFSLYTSHRPERSAELSISDSLSEKRRKSGVVEMWNCQVDGLEQNARTGRTLDMYKGIDQKRANFASDGRGTMMLRIDEAMN